MSEEEKKELPKGTGVFLGDREVMKVEEEGDFSTITFTDDSTALLHNELYGILQSEEPVEEQLADLLYLAVAKTFFAQLVRYNLQGSQVKGVARYLENLSVNAYNDATRLMWGNNYPEQVHLQDIMKVLDEHKKETDTN